MSNGFEGEDYWYDNLKEANLFPCEELLPFITRANLNHLLRDGKLEEPEEPEGTISP